MRILHYTLGFVPHRTGGLVKYVSNLMSIQSLIGHDVTALYPGNFSFLSKKSSLKFESVQDGIRIFCLTNALPIPLFYGVNDPLQFMAPRTIIGFEEWINDVKPDVFHVHTLMGLPIELLRKIKEHGIKIVYTTHDYYGLCFRVNFIDYKGGVCNLSSSANCELCNYNASTTIFLKVRNSKIILPLKQYLK